MHHHQKPLNWNKQIFVLTNILFSLKFSAVIFSVIYIYISLGTVQYLCETKYFICLHNSYYFYLFQNNVTPNNNTPLQPLNGDSPGTLSSPGDSVPSNPGSRKRPSDTGLESLRKKIKRAEENSNQVCNIICIEIGF
jgi:hypothetical protein